MEKGKNVVDDGCEIAEEGTKKKKKHAHCPNFCCCSQLEIEKNTPAALATERRHGTWMVPLESPSIDARA